LTEANLPILIQTVIERDSRVSEGRSAMMESDGFGEGGYRFKDLQQARIVSTRSDLHEKQKMLGFPRPIKLGSGTTAGAWFPKSEVHAWLRKRAALRDNSAK
jgi:predicted DNA-binding transcriptional regulator AlpA